MYKLLVLCLLVVMVSETLGRMACGPEFCKSYKCPRLENCKGEYMADGAGRCGCCPHCINILGEGEDCDAVFQPGSSQSYKCADGTYCDIGDTAKCTRHKSRG